MDHIGLAEQHRRTLRPMPDTQRRVFESARWREVEETPEPEARVAEPPPSRGITLPRF